MRVALAMVVVAACARPSPKRPVPQQNRAAEDWSVLADPTLRTEPLDGLKYLGLGKEAFLSLGLTLRERAESIDAPLFGAKGKTEDAYDLQRLQVHADLHPGAHWNLFVQVEDVRAFGKDAIGPSDVNYLDLRQAFVKYEHEAGPGTFKLRVGRQELSFDLQRFISLRDGPNVQQGFDGVWAAWDAAPWKVLALASLPVEYAHAHYFDDSSSFDDRLGLLRIEHKLGQRTAASAYYARYDRNGEKRDIFDARFVGVGRGFDWDAEGMVQTGHIGAVKIRAWATGARGGYTLGATRFGIQLDSASGDRDANDGTSGTFTPLFPNGYYFTLASYTGYSNLIHVKPVLTQHLTRDLTAMASWGLQWRETTADAIYLHPLVALPGSAGVGGAWTGSYLQLRSEYAVGPMLVLSAEFVHYQAGAVIRAAGGANSDYTGVEAKLSF